MLRTLDKVRMLTMVLEAIRKNTLCSHVCLSVCLFVCLCCSLTCLKYNLRHELMR